MKNGIHLGFAKVDNLSKNICAWCYQLFGKTIKSYRKWLYKLLVQWLDYCSIVGSDLY